MNKNHQENKNSNDISLIQKDIEIIQKDMNEVKLDLKAVLGHYVQKDEFNEKVKELEKKIEKKVDIDDFTPWKTTLKNINWLLIVAFFGALFALVLK